MRELKRRIKASSQAEVARELGIKAPLVSNVAAGKMNPCGRLLTWLGYRRVVVYKKVA